MTTVFCTSNKIELIVKLRRVCDCFNIFLYKQILLTSNSSLLLAEYSCSLFDWNAVNGYYVSSWKTKVQYLKYKLR